MHLRKECGICKIKEVEQFSSMCLDCIDAGWRWAGFPNAGYYKEKSIKKSIHRIKPKVVK